MKTTLKTAIGVTAVVMGLNISPPAAHADIITSIGDDSEEITCLVLAEDLDGRTLDDMATLIGVGEAIAKRYKVSQAIASQVINYQVETYCPRFWPNVVAVGASARAGDI